MTNKAITTEAELQQVKAKLEEQMKIQVIQPAPVATVPSKPAALPQFFTVPKLSAPVIYASMISKFLEKTKCSIDIKDKIYLLDLLSYKKIAATTIRYRGSEHGWNFIDFHSRCDKRGLPMISLFQMKDGDCIGGFTKA